MLPRRWPRVAARRTALAAANGHLARASCLPKVVAEATAAVSLIEMRLACSKRQGRRHEPPARWRPAMSMASFDELASMITDYCRAAEAAQVKAADNTDDVNSSHERPQQTWMFTDIANGPFEDLQSGPLAALPTQGPVHVKLGPRTSAFHLERVCQQFQPNLIVSYGSWPSVLTAKICQNCGTAEMCMMCRTPNPQHCKCG